MSRPRGVTATPPHPATVGAVADGPHKDEQDATPGATPRFLTPAQVAEELAVTESQVYTLMRSGELPAVKIGRRGVWRVSRRSLDAFVAGLYAAAQERPPRPSR